jgi:molybdate transport system substrate-binding protein
MKRATILLTTTLLAAFICGCTPTQTGEAEVRQKKKLIVFAAASLTEVLTEIESAYRIEKPDIELVFNFDSSGSLKTQILEGAACDVFVSAGQSQMDAIDVVEGSQKELLENKVCLAVPAKNPLNLRSFNDLERALASDGALLCIGNADVPVGQYSSQILSYFGLDETDLAQAGKITYASNVKEIVAHISEQVVDGGFIYTTDAEAAGLTIADIAPQEACKRIVYPAAVPSSSQIQDEALAFLAYLMGKEASDVFRSAGFVPLGDL